MIPQGYGLIVEGANATDLLGSVRFAEATAKDPFVPGAPFQLAKTGTFFSNTYGKITISAADLQTMYRNFKTKTPQAPTQLPIDYDHLSDDPQKPGDGQAAGWIQDLEMKPDGTLWATPKWTKKCAAMIANGEYRFISPFFIVNYQDKNSGKKIGPTLKAAAVTNRPFLEGMQPIPPPSIAASDTLAQQLGKHQRVAVTRAYRLGQQAAPATTRQGARAMKTCTKCHKALTEAAIAFAEEVSGTPGTITCPHCGAPVKYATAPAPEAPVDEPPADGPAPLEEGGGDADAVEEMAAPSVDQPIPPPAPEMDDAPAAEMIEPASGPKTDSTSATADQAESMEAAEGQPKEPKPAVSTSMSEVKQLREQVRQLNEKNTITEKALKDVQRRQRRQVAHQLTQRGLREGKLTPKLIGSWEKPGWALAEAYNRPKGFDHWLRETAPILVDMSERGTGKDPDAVSTETVGLADQLDRLATDMVKANPGMVYADAMRRVNASPDGRRLAERYDRAMSLGHDRVEQVTSAKSAAR